MKQLGIDLGGTSAKMGVVENGEVLLFSTVATRSDSDYNGILQALVAEANRLRSLCPFEQVGIGSPGLIDSQSGQVCYSNNIRWSDAPLRDDLTRLLALPVRLANDAKCAALGEAVYGAGQGHRRVAMLTLGTGVGGAFVLDGALEKGSLYEDASGILGHMTLFPGGRLCSCGRKGCLEAYCSATALALRAKETFGVPMSAKALFEKASANDRRACELVEAFSHHLATALVSLANVWRPECFVIGGGMSASADRFLPYVNDVLRQEVFGSAYAPVRAVKASLGNRAGLIGATLL